jgi:peptidoglycan/xylan/chitin deacetylase (PgdA/CDA1 family)
MCLAGLFAAIGTTISPVHAEDSSRCPNLGALGVARTVEIDTTGGPGFGFEHYKMYDFLVQKEVVLTFDDGPWTTTPLVLAALAAECTKATFFPIGLHATYYPNILKEVAAAGHTIGSHTWSHKNLKKLKPDNALEEIEKGLSAVKLALGGPPAPFFRFPELVDSPETLKYLASRNIAILSCDVDSRDFAIHKADKLVKYIIDTLERKGKGIILIHDNHEWSAQAVPALLTELKSKGYRVVHMTAKGTATSLPQWDDWAKSQIKGAEVGTSAPLSSVVRTIGSTDAPQKK